jgi:hypothetical protein
LKKLANKIACLSDVPLEALHSEIPDDKPQLESSEPFAKWYLPVLLKILLTHVVFGNECITM